MFMLTTSLGISAMAKPVLTLLPLGHLSKHSLTLHGLTIADTRAGHRGRKPLLTMNHTDNY